MSVHLTPSSSLGFNRPFTNSIKRILTISNNNAQPVAFKVKTTAPKLYCVRPNTGRIEPGDSVDVSVMLQQMKEEPPLSAKCKDKFLVQSTFITPEKETRGLQDIWNVVDSSEECKVHSQKLRVVYLPPEGQVLEEEEEAISREPSGIHYGVEKEANGHTPIVPQFQHEESSPEQHRDAPERIFTPPPEQQVMHDSLEEQAERPDFGVINVNVHSATPPAPAPAPPAINRELEEKYKEAQAEIQRLRALLAAVPDPSSIADNESVDPSTAAPTELRRRHATSAISEDGRSTYSRSEVGTMVDDHAVHQEGVPLQVVIIIAVGVFVTTYLFF